MINAANLVKAVFIFFSLSGLVDLILTTFITTPLELHPLSQMLRSIDHKLPCRALILKWVSLRIEFGVFGQRLAMRRIVNELEYNWKNDP